MPPPTASCFVPALPVPGNGANNARVLEAHRSARFDALLQLISEVQRRRDIDEVAAVVAARWKHCASVTHWRLVSVYGGQAVCIRARGARVEVEERPLVALDAYDANQWQRSLPQELSGPALAEARPSLPAELAGPQAVHLTVLPLLQGSLCVGMLNAVSSAPPDALDRKFIAQVVAAMSARVVTILTERTLTAGLLRAERQLAEHQNAAMLGRIVGGIAHELNTPLAVQISACASLLPLLEGMGVDPELSDVELSDVVKLVETQAHRAAGIVRRLKQVLAASTVAPAQPTPLVQTLGMIAAGQAAHKNAPTIDVSGPDDAISALDPNALGCVIAELLDNARLHGARRVELAVVPLALPASGWCIEVRDDGPGMADDVAAQMFEPFFTTGRARGLIGLGGYIALNLARDALGATMQVQSAVGRGTVVRLNLGKAAPAQP